MVPPPETIPIRVLYISPGGAEGRGGMGRMAKYLRAAFQAYTPGLQVRVLDPYGSGKFAPMLWRFSTIFLEVLSACTRHRVDVLHVHMSFGGSAIRKLSLVRLAALFKIGSIIHIHGSEFRRFYEGLPHALKVLLVSSMERASRIVVIGSYWRDLLVETLGVDPDKVVVIRNGVPLPPVPPERSRTGPYRILALGILSERKGTHDLLNALARLGLPPGTWRATIAGNGDIEKYRKQAIELGLADLVEIPGWVDAAAAQSLLAAADLLVLPSYNEGLPVAILEAMAAALPVVATPVGAIEEAVITGETGILVAPGDVEALAAAFSRLIGDRELSVAMGRAGRRRFEDGFTIEQAAASLVQLYETVAGRGAAA